LLRVLCELCGLIEVFRIISDRGGVSMKVVAFNGSPRKEGNTYHSIRIVFEELEKEGIETESYSLAALISKAAGRASNVLKKRTSAASRRTPLIHSSKR